MTPEEQLSKDGNSKQGGNSQMISGNSEKPSSGSTWSQPKDIKQLAAQANKVATMLLNNNIDLEVARSYSAIIRTVAQAVTAETQRARFLKTQPDLSLDDYDE